MLLRRGPGHADAGVSEIVGTILLTALAVVFAAGFVVLLFTLPPPDSAAAPAIQAYVLPTHADQLVLEHRGGPSIPLSQLTATVTINGTATTYTIGKSLGVWSVTSPDGTVKGSGDRFSSGDRAILASSTLYGAQASALVTDPGVNALVLSPSQLRPITTPANITSAQTLTNDTIRIDLDKTLATIAPADFRIDGVAPTAARIVGSGASVELVAAAPFATSATPTVTTGATVSGTFDTSGLAFGTFASRVANDTLAPAISAGPTATDPDTTLANVSWTTTELSTSSVEYGPTTALGITSTNTALVTSHAITITQLTPGTLYYYRVVSTDAAGNANATALATFVTDPVASGAVSFSTTDPHTWTAVQTFGAGDLKVSDVVKGANTYQLPTNADTLAGVGNVQTFSALQTFGAGATISSGQALLLAPTATGSLPADSAGKLVYDSTLGALRVGTGSGLGTVLTNGNVTAADIASGTLADGRLASNVSRIDQAKTWSALQTFGSNAALDGSTITSGTVSASRLPTAAAGVAGIIPSTGVTSAMITDGTIANADVSATAAIAYSKLALSNSILTGDIADGTIANADISSSAAIAYSKLALSNSIVAGDLTTGSVTSAKILDDTITNADVNSAAAIAYSKLNLAGSIVTGDITDGTITNADISASAAIADSKLATISTAGKVSDSALSSNVALLTGTQTFSGAKTFGAGATVSSGQALVLGPTATASLPAASRGGIVYDSTTDTVKAGIGSTPAYQTLAALGTANTWSALQTFGSNAALDGSTITSGTVGASRLPTASAGVAGIIPSTGVTSAMITDGTIAVADTSFIRSISTLSFDIGSTAVSSVGCATVALANSLTTDHVLATPQSMPQFFAFASAQISSNGNVQVCLTNIDRANSAHDPAAINVVIVDMT